MSYTPPPNGGAGDVIALENVESKEDATGNVETALENVATINDEAVVLEKVESKEDTEVKFEGPLENIVSEEDVKTVVNVANPLENAETKEDTIVNPETEEDATKVNVASKEDATEVNVVDKSSLGNVETKEDVPTAANVVVEDDLENVENKDVLGIIVEDEESFRTTGDQDGEENQLEDQLVDEDECGNKDNKDGRSSQ